MTNACLDIEAPGYDRDSGHGIVMTTNALNFINAKGDFNLNGQSDLIFQNARAGASRLASQWLRHWRDLSDLGTVATSWNIVGLGDFNRDGYTDVLARIQRAAVTSGSCGGGTRIVMSLSAICDCLEFCRSR